MSATSILGTDSVQADAFMKWGSSGEGRSNIHYAAQGLRSAGHLYLHCVAITGSQTVDESTYNGTCYLMTCSGADATLTLPAAAACIDKVIEIQKADTTAYAVYIEPNSTETIDS